MRRLMWLSLGVSLSCGIGAYWMNGTWMLPLAIALLGLSLAVGFFGGERKLLRCFAWMLAGISLGFGCFFGFRQAYLLPALELDGEKQEAVITVSDYGWETNYGSVCEGKLELDGKLYRVRFYLNEKLPIEPGDRIRGTFRFRVTTSDSAEGATQHQGKGIFLLAYQAGKAERTEGADTGIEYLPVHLRRNIKDCIRRCFPEDTFAFAQALLLGDSSELNYDVDTAFKISGIRHIIAVSGLHVSIFYGLIHTLTLKRRYLTALVGGSVLFVFAAVAGFTPSVVRACIMVGLMMLANVCNREYDGPTELGFAGLVILLLNPLSITSVSFQLSFASVAGIFLFNERILNWLKSLLGDGKGKSLKALLTRWFMSSVSVSLSAVSLTTPLCAWYFGLVSLIGPVTNLLTLWAVSLIFYGIMAVCLLDLFAGTLAGILATVISWLIRYVVGAAKCCAAIPLAAVYTTSIYIILWLVLVYVMLALFLLMRKRNPKQLICCAVMGLCIALLCSWSEPLRDDCRVTVLDVGQGQCILLQSAGKTFLVDCGGDYAEAAADLAADTLLSQGIAHLDGVILTHYDADHAGGVPYLLTRVDADCIFVPDCDDGGVREVIAAATDGQLIRVWDDCSIGVGEAEITIFGPIYSGDSNENSLCVLFETEKCAILITGDRSAFGERMLLREHTLPKVDLLIAGHHGSKHSTSEELLAAVQPDTVIISVGENSYGHPSNEVLQRLAECGCAVYRTDQHGTIIFRR